MKTILKVSVGMLLLASLFLTACSTPPPPVSQDQLETAEMETVKAEEVAADKSVELKELKKEVSMKQAELDNLKEYQRQLDAE